MTQSEFIERVKFESTERNIQKSRLKDMKVKMPVWKLVDKHQEKHPGGNFFDDKTFAYFDMETLDHIAV